MTYMKNGGDAPVFLEKKTAHQQQFRRVFEIFGALGNIRRAAFFQAKKSRAIMPGLLVCRLSANLSLEVVGIAQVKELSSRIVQRSVKERPALEEGVFRWLLVERVVEP